MSDNHLDSLDNGAVIHKHLVVESKISYIALTSFALHKFLIILVVFFPGCFSKLCFFREPAYEFNEDEVAHEYDIQGLEERAE